MEEDEGACEWVFEKRRREIAKKREDLLSMFVGRRRSETQFQFSGQGDSDSNREETEQGSEKEAVDRSKVKEMLMASSPTVLRQNPQSTEDTSEIISSANPPKEEPTVLEQQPHQLQDSASGANESQPKDQEEQPNSETKEGDENRQVASSPELKKDFQVENTCVPRRGEDLYLLNPYFDPSIAKAEVKAEARAVLTEEAGLLPSIGEPISFNLEGSAGPCIIFRGVDRRFYIVMACTLESEVSWVHRLLNAKAPRSEEHMFIYDVMQGGKLLSKRLLYIGEDRNLHELSLSFRPPFTSQLVYAALNDAIIEREWEYENLTEQSHAPFAVGGIKGYYNKTSPTKGELHVIYKGGDGFVHVLKREYEKNAETQSRWMHMNLAVISRPFSLFCEDKAEASKQPRAKRTTQRKQAILIRPRSSMELGVLDKEKEEVQEKVTQNIDALHLETMKEQRTVTWGFKSCTFRTNRTGNSRSRRFRSNTTSGLGKMPTPRQVFLSRQKIIARAEPEVRKPWITEQEVTPEILKKVIRVQAQVRMFLAKRLLKRLFVANELLKTEESYVHSLGVVVSAFLKPLAEIEVLPMEQIHAIFGDTELLFQHHSKFCTLLHARIRDWELVKTKSVGDIFVKDTGFLLLYTGYVNNYNIAIETLTKAKRESPAFADFINRCEQRPECDFQDLHSFLIMPIQRVPRYLLLLEDLLRKTTKGTSSYESLVCALETIKGTADFINEQKRQSENLERRLQIQKMLVGKHVKELGLNTQLIHRTLLKEGRLETKDGRKLKTKHLFLFTDMILITTPSPPISGYSTLSRLSTKGILHSSSSNSLVGDESEGNLVYHVLDLEYLENYTAVTAMPPAAVNQKPTFQLATFQKKYSFLCNSEKICNEWVAAIEGAWMAYKQKQQEMQQLQKIKAKEFLQAKLTDRPSAQSLEQLNILHG